jgi:hypothetical protein
LDGLILSFFLYELLVGFPRHIPRWLGRPIRRQGIDHRGATGQEHGTTHQQDISVPHLFAPQFSIPFQRRIISQSVSSLSAQWEHTVLMTEMGYEVLTVSAGMPPEPAQAA